MNAAHIIFDGTRTAVTGQMSQEQAVRAMVVIAEGIEVNCGEQLLALCLVEAAMLDLIQRAGGGDTKKAEAVGGAEIGNLIMGVADHLGITAMSLLARCAAFIATIQAKVGKTDADA